MSRTITAGRGLLLLSLLWGACAWSIPTPKLVAASDAGQPVVYDLGDGSYLGLFSFAFSDHRTDVTLDRPEDLLAGFSGGEVIGLLAPDFGAFAFPATFERRRHEGALWVRWNPEPGLALTYSWNYLNRGGVERSGSESIDASATRPGNPLATTIAEPSAFALLAFALFALTIGRRRLRRPMTLADSI
jgi:hypothetical protein